MNSHAFRYSVTIMIFLLMVVAGVVISLILVRNAIAQNDSQWCQTLDLLTRHPVARPTNPTANPSRQDAYQLFQNFLTLRHRFGC